MCSMIDRTRFTKRPKTARARYFPSTGGGRKNTFENGQDRS